jgi:putative transposase
MIQEIAFKYTFYGYRRIHLAMHRQGIRINHKKVYRIYKSLDLQRQKPRKNKRVSMPRTPLTEPRYPNHIWAVDFLFDSLASGRLIKFITIEDIFSRFCPGIDVHFSIPARIAVEVLEKCIGLFGIPGIIRTDQGTEFRSLTFQKFLQKQGIRHEFIEKASPWQNGNLESFNGKFRDECLNRNIFEDIP